MEEWWNSKSYDEKMELVAGIESEEEVYKNYRKYANENRRLNRIRTKNINQTKTKTDN